MVLKLVFTGVAGRNLAAKDITGFSDPYLFLTFNGQKKRSKIIYQNLNPRWHQKFVFDLPTLIPEDGIEFVIECWDWDKIGTDDFMGVINLLIKPGDVKEEPTPKEPVWTALQNRPKKKEEISGDLCYNIEFIRDELCDFKEEVKPIKAGYLQMLGKTALGKSQVPKKRYLFVTKDSLAVYTSEKMDDKPLYEIIDLKDEVKEVRVVRDQKEVKANSCAFAIATTTYKEKTFIFICETQTEMISWALTISALQAGNGKSSLLDSTDRILLTNTQGSIPKTLFFVDYKGGEVTSSQEENWTYSNDGTLHRSADSQYQESFYNWDGENITYVSGKNYGRGRWDGVYLYWLNSDNSVENPLYVYIFQDGQYSNCGVETGMDYKWTRHFLASKAGKGHWSVEGSVPQPVVMFLQMMRFMHFGCAHNQGNDLIILLLSCSSTSMSNSFVTLVKSDLYTLFIFLSSIIVCILELLGVNLLPFVAEFKIFGSLIFGTCTGTGLVVLLGSLYDKIHILMFSVPFLIVEELLLGLTILLLFDLKNQANTSLGAYWYIALIGVFMQIVIQLLFVISAIRRRKKLLERRGDRPDVNFPYTFESLN